MSGSWFMVLVLRQVEDSYNSTCHRRAVKTYDTGMTFG